MSEARHGDWSDLRSDICGLGDEVIVEEIFDC